MDKYNFQVCQKIIVFSRDYKEVLLCKRKGENDYDGVFSFIGGKLESFDDSLLTGLKREKDEELGPDFKIMIYLKYSSNLFYVKKNGARMILPHYCAVYVEGEIKLNDEYSEFKWVPINALNEFEPKIKNIPTSVKDALLLKKMHKNKDLIEI